MADWLQRAQRKFSESVEGAAAIADVGDASAAKAAPRQRIPEKSAPLPTELRRRIEAMAARWRYSPDEIQDVLSRAQRDPAAWLRAVETDEGRESEFRARGLLS